MEKIQCKTCGKTFLFKSHLKKHLSSNRECMPTVSCEPQRITRAHGYSVTFAAAHNIMCGTSTEPRHDYTMSYEAARYARPITIQPPVTYASTASSMTYSYTNYPTTTWYNTTT